MDIKDLNLDRGLFQLTLPYTWMGWIGWIIGVVIVLAGIVNPLIFPVGLLIIALCSPGSLEADLHKVRKNAPQPESLEADALDKGY